ncbi:50S ribosomal protein L10 [Chloroflexota bacterium]
MPREKKTKVIDQIEELFLNSTSGILADYRGIKTADMNILRRKLRDSSIQCRVVKNTLARMAAEKSGKHGLSASFVGPVVAIFGSGTDVTAPVKLFNEFVIANKLSLSVKSGFIGDTIYNAEDMKAIASLPSRDELIGKVVSGFVAPIFGLVNCLASPMRGLAVVLQGRIKQLEIN